LVYNPTRRCGRIVLSSLIYVENPSVVTSHLRVSTSLTESSGNGTPVRTFR
jgi:hypothetical protein